MVHDKTGKVNARERLEVDWTGQGLIT